MKNILKYIFIGVLLCGFSMIVFVKHVHANALPQLDYDSWTVLEGQGGAYNDLYEFGLGADPNLIIYGMDSALQNINNAMYDAYGWDLENLAWYAEDWVADPNNWVGSGADNLAYTLSNGQYSTMADLINNGYTLFSAVTNTTTQSLFGTAKQFIMGKYDTATGTIKNVFNNALVKITPELLLGLGGITGGLISDNVISDMSVDSAPIYTNNVHGTVYADLTHQYNLFFNSNVYFWTATSPDYTTASDGVQRWYVRVMAETSDLSTIFKDGVTSAGYQISSVNMGYPTQVQINGKTYYYGTLRLYVQGNNTLYNLLVPNKMGNLANLQSWLENNTDSPTSSYNLSPTDTSGNTINWNDLFNQLNNKYVPIAELHEIIDLLHQIQVRPNFYPNPQPNGTPATLPEATPTPDQWGLLEDEIDRIGGIADQIQEWIADTPMTDPVPDPEPNPNPNPLPDTPNTGITVPDDFPTDPVFTPITDILTAPFDMLSIFKPIFALFGVNWLMPLWLLLPPIIIFILIIRALL